MDFWSIFVVFGAVVVGWAAHYAFLVLSERKALSIMRQKANYKGQAVQQDAADDLMSFLTELKLGFDKNKAAGGDLKEFATKEVPVIVLKHPRTAMRFGKKLYSLVGGDGEGIEGLLDGGLNGLLKE